MTSCAGRHDFRVEPFDADSVDWQARILDGEAVAGQIRAELGERIGALVQRGVRPVLGTLLVGADPWQRARADVTSRECAELGVASIERELPESADTAEVAAAIDEFNADPTCHGYLVQRALPADLDARALRERIDPDKDVEGLHPVNLGRLALMRWTPRPCVARGCVELLRRHGISMDGANVVVIGREARAHGTSSLTLASRAENATVTTCHSETRDLPEIVRRADIVISAADIPGLVTADMVKPWAVVLDVGLLGVPMGDEGRWSGDVDRRVSDVAGWLAPAVGGVAPVARAMLLTNVVDAAEHQLDAVG